MNRSNDRADGRSIGTITMKAPIEIKIYRHMNLEIECLSMLTLEMVARQGCSVLLLFIALQLQRALVQEALACLLVFFTSLRVTVPHLQIGCMNQKFSFYFRYSTAANIGIRDESMDLDTYFYGFRQTLQKW